MDRITDIRNFGAITRTAECAGVDAILIPEQNADDLTPSFKLIFKESQSSVTPGQAAVFYKGDILLGGGLIS